MNSGNKIILNTGIVYAQLIITAFITLFSVRFVLQALGEEDYGIYMLVAGVVALLKVLSGSMSNTSMRYMSHSLGKNDLLTSLQTFNTTLFIHYCLAFAIFVLFEFGGWVMFDYFLNIPEDKILSAKLIYQFMIVTTIVTVVSVPFDAVINSHENLLFLSVVKVFDSIAIFGISLSLLLYEGDRLIMYGLLLMILNIVVRIVKQIYTRKKYPECRVNFRKYRDKSLMKSILSFTGWDFLNSVAAICSTQIRGILINIFFGVRLNAAEGIGKKINTQLNTVSTGITRAITPQMNKREGGGNRESMISLMNTGVKYTTFMYCLFAVPLLMEIPFVLDVWLKEVPAYTVIFCQMCILLQMTDKFTWQIGNAIRAVGQIKGLQITSSVLALSGVIVGYFFFSMGSGPVSIYIIELVVCLLGAMARFYYGHKIVGLQSYVFIKKTTIPVIIPILISLICVVPIRFMMRESLLRFVLDFATYIIVNVLVFWSFSMSESEKVKLKEIVGKRLHKRR